MQLQLTINRLISLAVVWIFTIFTTMNAQAHRLVSAHVVDEEGAVIVVGNAIFRAKSDSSIVDGQLFYDGELRSDPLPSKPLFLQITALGYQTLYLDLDPDSQAPIADAGIIRLQALELTTVEVKARRPLVEQKGTDIVVNVANTGLTTLGTALEVLQSAPKVTVNNSGQIGVIGKGSALIYIDGQQISNRQVLENLPAADIDQIEIIENPSARYDAAGQAVINIKTKTKSLEGYKIGFRQEFEHGRYFRSFYGTNAYFQRGPLTLQTAYSYKPFQHYGRNDYGRAYTLGDEEVDIKNAYIYHRRKNTHNYQARVNYQISDEQRLGFQYTGNKADGHQSSNNTNAFVTNKPSTTFDMYTDAEAPFGQSNNAINGFYDLQLDTIGSLFKVSGQFATYKFDRTENILQELVRSGSARLQERLSLNANEIQLIALQSDYNWYVTPNSSWSFGGKYAQIQNQSSLRFANATTTGTFQLDPRFTNSYDYQEDIAAAYAEWSGQGELWNARVGLRTEWTRSTGIAGGEVDQTQFSREYWNVFPSGQLQYKPAGEHALSLSYNYRIQRPQFQDLNPFVWYADSLTSLRGNAALIPELGHFVDLNWSHKGWSLQASYNHVNNKINTIIVVDDIDDPAVFSFLRDNIDGVDNYSLSLSKAFQKGSYSAYLMLGGRYESHHYQDLGLRSTNTLGGYFVYANQSVSLPLDVKFDVTFSYTSPRVDGIYRDNPISYLHVGLTRKFWQNRLLVNLRGNDILDKWRYTGTANVYNNDWTYLSEGDWQYAKLTLQWDFGKLGQQAFSGQKAAAEELTRINQQ